MRVRIFHGSSGEYDGAKLENDDDALLDLAVGVYSAMLLHGTDEVHAVAIVGADGTQMIHAAKEDGWTVRLGGWSR